MRFFQLAKMIQELPLRHESGRFKEYGTESRKFHVDYKDGVPFAIQRVGSWRQHFNPVLKCIGDSKGVDLNILDMTSYRNNGHRFLKSTTYKNGEWDGRCLKCGLYVHMHGQKIDNFWW